MKNKIKIFLQYSLITITILFSSGCATIEGPANPDDPFESFNRSMFAFNEGADKYAFKPAAKGYNFIMPDFASKGVSNFFSNIDDIVVFANQLLQFKIAAAIATSARFVFNTTFGLLGLIDVASEMDLYKHNEDFGQTLGHWGVGTGPYLVLPLLGPSNVRDGIGLYPDFVLQNYIQGDLLAQPVRATAFLFDSIDTRANTSFRYYETGSAFEYQTVRWLYSTKRKLDVEK